MNIDTKMQRVMEIGQELHTCMGLDWMFESYWYNVEKGFRVSAKDLEEQIEYKFVYALELWMEYNQIKEDICTHNYKCLKRTTR